MAIRPVVAINITLDYTLDTYNQNWFDVSSQVGTERRAAVDTAAAFLSAIITNDDWAALPSFSDTIGLSDIEQSSIFDLAGSVLTGNAESDGLGYSYSIPVTNRSSVAANEYVIYVSAFPFDTGASSHAKAISKGDDYRNPAGLALTEFNTWGGYIFFDSDNDWFTGLNPGIDPTNDYGIQDPNKTPGVDISSDNWDWNTSSDSWKGFQLSTLDPLASGRTDLYGTALHELIHALGVTSGNFEKYLLTDTANSVLIGQHVMEVYGGPVPRSSTGHFAANVQSQVWDSDNIISEVLLDPNSTSGVRKYLTELDAALLRDLGYQVLDALIPADFNFDGIVDGEDLVLWQARHGVDDLADADGDGDSDGLDFLIWQRGRHFSASLAVASHDVPEPSCLVLLSFMATSGVTRTWFHIKPA